MGPMDWRKDSIAWIRNRAAKLALQPADRWEVGRPSDQACETAIRLIKSLKPDSPAPSALLVTLSEGIELEWRRENRLLSIEIMADGNLESLKSVDVRPIEEARLDEANSHMHSLLSWLDAA